MNFNGHGSRNGMDYGITDKGVLLALLFLKADMIGFVVLG